MPSDETMLFLDTNSLLHYPPIKDVDWKGVSAGKRARLILCMQVVHELDTKKDDPRLADRAARIIKEVEAILESGGQVKEGVRLEVFDYEIRAADFPDTLSPDSKDDRIVHTVKKYLERNPEAEAAVYTEDMGMRLRCKANGVAVAKPDAATRLENPQDELTRKYRTAISELNSLRNRLPVLKLQVAAVGEFPEKVEPLKFTLSRLWQPLDVDAELEKVYRAYPKFVAVKGGENPFSMRQVLEPSPSSEEWPRYNKKLDNFYLNYQIHLQRLNTWGENNDRAIAFDLWLGNTGNAPAEDIDVFLTLPPSLTYVADAASDAAKPLLRPDPPEPPERPVLRLPGGFDAGLLGSIRPLSAQIADLLADRDRDTVEVWRDRDGGSHVHAKIRKLKHGQHHMIGSFRAVFGSWEAVKPFNADFMISASELPDRVTGTIPFIIRTA